MFREETPGKDAVHLRRDVRDLTGGGAQQLDTGQFPTVSPARGLPKVMKVRFEEESIAPCALCVKDSAPERGSGQLPFIARARLGDGQGGGARAVPPPNPVGVRVVMLFKQGGASVSNVGQNSVSFRYQ